MILHCKNAEMAIFSFFNIWQFFYIRGNKKSKKNFFSKMHKFGPPAHFLPQLGSEHVYSTISLGFKGFVVWFVVVCVGLWCFVVWFVVVCGVLWCLVPPIFCNHDTFSPSTSL